MVSHNECTYPGTSMLRMVCLLRCTSRRHPVMPIMPLSSLTAGLQAARRCGAALPEEVERVPPGKWRHPSSPGNSVVVLRRPGCRRPSFRSIPLFVFVLSGDAGGFWRSIEFTTAPRFSFGKSVWNRFRKINLCVAARGIHPAVALSAPVVPPGRTGCADKRGRAFLLPGLCIVREGMRSRGLLPSPPSGSAFSGRFQWVGAALRSESRRACAGRISRAVFS